jgi:soluble lytic murein transglycosylase
MPLLCAIMRLIFVTVLLAISCSVVAQASDINAIKAAASGKYNVPAQTSIGRDIVDWYKYTNEDQIRFRQAYQFLKTNSDWPQSRKIQTNIEKSISNATPTNELLRYFDQFAPVTATGMMHYLNALTATNQKTKATTTFKNWWYNAKLTPNEQVDFLARYGSLLSRQDNERRMNHIIHDKFYTNARALSKKLGNGYPALVEAKIALIEQKTDVNKTLAAVPSKLKNNEALVLARIQWRRKNNEDQGAIELLNNAPTHNQMTQASSWWKERHIMARRLMEEKRWKDVYKLVSNHRQKDGFSFAQAEFVAGWVALRKLNRQWEAFEHFERLFNAVKSPISRARGSYWAGLASETLGHPEIAKQWYRVAANYQTTYYGQIAAQNVGVTPALVVPTPFQETTQKETSFKNAKLVIASKLLLKADDRKSAKLFLYAYTDNNSSNDKYYYAANLAEQLDLNDAALRIAKKAERDNFVMPNHLFPIVKRAMSTKYAVHPAFIHGIIRQESAFDQYAQSHAGALGLMQLMPATAKETAQKAGLSYRKSKLTSDPSFNMTLGAMYIHQMMERWDQNRILAIASYNAGPGRVNGFLKKIGDPRKNGIDSVDWVESIPIYETRNYVQRVTEALNVYARMIK